MNLIFSSYAKSPFHIIEKDACNKFNFKTTIIMLTLNKETHKSARNGFMISFLYYIDFIPNLQSSSIKFIP
jgi:hypothetical protein